jgi:hypothetical protein
MNHRLLGIHSFLNPFSLFNIDLARFLCSTQEHKYQTTLTLSKDLYIPKRPSNHIERHVKLEAKEHHLTTETKKNLDGKYLTHYAVWLSYMHLAFPCTSDVQSPWLCRSPNHMIPPLKSTSQSHQPTQSKTPLPTQLLLSNRTNHSSTASKSLQQPTIFYWVFMIFGFLFCLFKKIA